MIPFPIMWCGCGGQKWLNGSRSCLGAEILGDPKRILLNGGLQTPTVTGPFTVDCIGILLLEFVKFQVHEVKRNITNRKMQLPMLYVKPVPDVDFLVIV